MVGGECSASEERGGFILIKDVVDVVAKGEVDGVVLVELPVERQRESAVLL